MQIELVQIFIQVVKSGSFTRAASHLHLPKSTVSKAVAKLEKQAGTKLLLRTTRHQSLTEAGKKFYDSCVVPLEALELASKSLYGTDSLISGMIKLTAPEDLGSNIISPAVATLCQKHPELKFELHYTDETLDLVKDGYDLAIRIGELVESGLKVKKVGTINLLLVASSSYLKSKPSINRITDLQKHDCLVLSRFTRATSWSLKNRSTSEEVLLHPRVISNQMSSLIKVAMSGGGIALVPDFLCRPYFKQKKLIQVLPNWKSPDLSVSILSPLPFSSSARLRATADYLSLEIQKALAESQ